MMILLFNRVMWFQINKYLHCISEPDPDKIVKTFEKKELKTKIADQVDNNKDKSP